jgi:hypothetical protein
LNKFVLRLRIKACVDVNANGATIETGTFLYIKKWGAVVKMRISK